MTDWRLIHVPSGEVQDDLEDVVVVDAFNRYAREGRAVIFDPNSIIPAKYPRGTLVEIQYRKTGEITWSTRFGGFVVDQDIEKNETKLSFLSHDVWIKKRTVLEDYEDKNLSFILEDLIEKYTPLIWDPSLISIVNDEVITRRWQGEALDEILFEIASISGEEEFGATDDAKFFFRPQQISNAPYNYVPGTYLESEFERQTRQEINRVTIFYGEDPDRAKVFVENTDAQLELAEKIGVDKPVVIEVLRNYPEITFDPSIPGSKEKAEERATSKGNRILEGEQSVLIGDVITWASEGHMPGDIVQLIDPDVGVDESFRIASITYSMVGNVRVKLAENVENVVDILLSLNEEKTRIDLRDVDVDVPGTLVNQVDGSFSIVMTVDIIKIQVPDDMFLFGAFGGNLGDPDPDVGGGLLGDQRTMAVIENIPPGGSII